MHSPYLGEGYRDEIRKILGVDEELCPNGIIDAPLNIGSMKRILQPAAERVIVHGKVKNEEDFKIFQEAARYVLAAILCSAIKSRVKVAPFNKYKHKNWAKKQKKLMAKGELLIGQLIGGGVNANSNLF